MARTGIAPKTIKIIDTFLNDYDFVINSFRLPNFKDYFENAVLVKNNNHFSANVHYLTILSKVISKITSSPYIKNIEVSLFQFDPRDKDHSTEYLRGYLLHEQKPKIFSDSPFHKAEFPSSVSAINYFLREAQQFQLVIERLTDVERQQFVQKELEHNFALKAFQSFSHFYIKALLSHPILGEIRVVIQYRLDLDGDGLIRVEFYPTVYLANSPFTFSEFGSLYNFSISKKSNKTKKAKIKL